MTTTLIEKDSPGPALLLIFVVLLLLAGGGLGLAYIMGAFGGHVAETNTQTIIPPITLPNPVTP